MSPLTVATLTAIFALGVCACSGDDDTPAPSAAQADVADVGEDVAEDDIGEDVTTDVATDAPGDALDVAPDAPDPDPRYPLDGVLRLNQIQVLGTHNSYHTRFTEPLVEEWSYTFDPLDVQLGEQGVRQFEIDVHWDDALNDFRVYHLGGVDADSTCDLFTDCLGVLKGWSDDNPDHHALFVWIEPKDELDEVKLTGRIDDLDGAILEVWPRERIVAPADVLKDASSMAEAVATTGWPTLGESRGKIVFVLLDTGVHRDELMGNGFERGVIFPRGGNEDDFAAFVDYDSDRDADAVRAAVEGGRIVRDKIDGTPLTDDERSGAKRDAALAAGTQLLSTDYPVAVEGVDYVVSMPGGTPSRCNPINAPPECTPEDVEDLEGR